MRFVVHALLTAVLFGLSATPGAEERNRSGKDTSRHGPREPPRSSIGAGDVRLQSRPGASYGLTEAERRDPAVRQYWSSKCVQQRSRGWGHSGDCESPAYTGGGIGSSYPSYYGYPPRYPTPYSGYGGNGVNRGGGFIRR